LGKFLFDYKVCRARDGLDIEKSDPEVAKMLILFKVYSKQKKMCRLSARRLSIYNIAWELLKASKKYV
jgi:hypothetical protein